jgi:outer membrane protein assembly factor BamA
MAGNKRTKWGLALFGACLLAQSTAHGQAGPASVRPTRAELESRGATIRDVNIVVDNVFDPDNPEEDKRLYRWANKMHTPTNVGVIEHMLLFAEGDAFEGRLLDESARALRATPFLSQAEIEPRDYDAATNTVAVDVRVRDSWTLAPDFKLNHKGGATEFGIGIADDNLFGTGKDLTVKYLSGVDRDEVQLGYTDTNVAGSRIHVNAWSSDASDGHRHAVDAGRPFYSLDTPWSLGGGVLDEDRVDSMYDLGEVVDEFRHEVQQLTLSGGFSSGVVDRHTHRWLYGVTSVEERFTPALDRPAPTLLPEDRKLVFPWVGIQWAKDDFREMSELNDMGRTEDISLGLNVTMSLGLAKRSFGSDRDATLFRLDTQRGWEPGGDGHLLTFNAGASGRDESDGLHNSTVYAGARYFQRNFEKGLFSVNLQALAADNLDAENQVLLGGDNGLRGYPLRYQAGTGRASLSAEQRFYTDWYPWRLVRMGYAVFFDTGRVWGTDPRGQPSLGMLSDVGAGLRLTSPRSSGRSVVHVDLAFPLNGGPDIDSVQLVVETKTSF